MSFFKRLVLFFLILAALILFFGLFPVVAHSQAADQILSSGHSFILLHIVP
jgi:hypothetical protein